MENSFNFQTVKKTVNQEMDLGSLSQKIDDIY